MGASCGAVRADDVLLHLPGPRVDRAPRIQTPRLQILAGFTWESHGELLGPQRGGRSPNFCAVPSC